MGPLHVSELTCYLRCPKEHQYAYVDRRVPKYIPEALEDGTSVHRWLEEWWETALLREGEMPEKPSLRAMLRAYDAVHRGPNLHHIRVEQPWAATIAGVECAGTVDVVGFDDNGDEVVVEHKTTSSDISPGSQYWRERYVCDVQITMYSAAFPGAKVLYDVLRKPALRKLRAGKPTEETDAEFEARCLEVISEDPSKYFQRAIMVRLEADHAAFAEDVRIVDERRRLPMQPRNSKACFSFGRQCGYFGVCWEGKSLRDDNVFTDQDENR